jgi:hypothetical protein
MAEKLHWMMSAAPNELEEVLVPYALYVDCSKAQTPSCPKVALTVHFSSESASLSPSSSSSLARAVTVNHAHCTAEDLRAADVVEANGFTEGDALTWRKAVRMISDIGTE